MCGMVTADRLRKRRVISGHPLQHQSLTACERTLLLRGVDLQNRFRTVRNPVDAAITAKKAAIPLALSRRDSRGV